jgi:hypothetical protein
VGRRSATLLTTAVRPVVGGYVKRERVGATMSVWLMLTVSTLDARAAVVAVVIALLVAALAWLLFRLIAPAYAGAAAIFTFVVLLLVLVLT